MDFDTQMGGPGHRFPATRHSAFLGLRSEDGAVRARAYETLIAAYWKPVYKYIRLKWNQSNEDAKDLTQAFFARAIEKEFFAGYDASRAAFRTYLRTCLNGFVANEIEYARRQKRALPEPLLPLDFESAESELKEYPVAAGESLENYFHQEWVRGLFGLTVDRLRAECEREGKLLHFTLFDRYVLQAGEDRPTYEALARECGIPATAVTNHLAAMRRKFRRLVLDTLREITANEREFRSEARALLGTDA